MHYLQSWASKRIARCRVQLLWVSLILAPSMRCDATGSHLRSSGIGKTPSRTLQVAPLHAAIAKSHSHAVLNESSDLRSSSGHIGNASWKLNATVEVNSTSNSTTPFDIHSYGPEIGKVFALYYSTASGEKVTEIVAREYKVLSAPPANDVVFHPVTAQTLSRGNCPFKLKASTSYVSDWRKYNLRLAEVAICEIHWGSPCPSGKGCEIEIFAPFPYSSNQEPYLAAGMALTAHSLLCSKRVKTWQTDSCKINRQQNAIAAGLQTSSSGIILKKIPGAWVDLKLDATYHLRFQGATFAQEGTADYQNSQNFKDKDDVLKWQRHPPKAEFCTDLSCLVSQYEQR